MNDYVQSNLSDLALETVTPPVIRLGLIETWRIMLHAPLTIVTEAIGHCAFDRPVIVTEPIPNTDFLLGAHSFRLFAISSWYGLVLLLRLLYSYPYRPLPSSTSC
jgi:hypothetical protein